MIEEIIPRIYVGSDEGYQKVQYKPGWSFLRACKDGIDGHRDNLHYDSRSAPKGKDYYFVQKKNLMALNLIDSNDPDFIPEEVINAGLKFIKSQLDKTNNKILISCNAGSSRSPTIVFLFLRSIGELPDGYSHGAKIFKTLYHKWNPNPGVKGYAQSHYDELGTKD